MIDLDHAPLHGKGVTIFFDHAQPNRFYYLADRPRLRRNAEGIPELMLLKYRLDPNLHKALGAGLLTFAVDLGLDEETLDRLRGRIAAAANLSIPPELAPLAAETASCDLTLIDRSTKESPPGPGGGGSTPAFELVEKILGAASPSLYGDHQATFAAVLSPEGVALVEGALRGGGLPAGVIYTLGTLGLRPALRAEITARWTDAYQYCENRFHGGKLLLAVDLGETVADLVRSEAITVSIDEMVPEAECSGVYQQALDQVQRYILEQFFKPTLGETPTERPSGILETIGRGVMDVLGLFTFTYTLRNIDRSELKTMRYNLRASEAERIALAPQGVFSAMLAGQSAATIDRLIIEVEPTASAEMKFDVGSVVELGADEIDHLEVTLEYGDRRETLLLDAKTPRQSMSFWYKPDLGSSIRMSFEVHFRGDEAGRLGVLPSAASTTSNRVIRLNPRDLYQRVELRVAARGVPFQRYPSVIVDLEAKDLVDNWTAIETLELTASRPEGTWRALAGPQGVVRFRRRIRYLDATGQELLQDWDEVDPGVLIVGDPLPALVDVQVLGSARFGTVVRRLIVELRPKSDPQNVTALTLSAEKPSATWSWAAGSAVERDYEYRVTVYTIQSEVREGQWLPGPPGKLIVGEGIARVRTIQLMLLGPGLAQLGLLALKVRFWFEDPESGLSAENEMMVQDLSKPISWSYPVADAARQQYNFQLTYLRNDGTFLAKDPVSTSALLEIQTMR